VDGEQIVVSTIDLGETLTKFYRNQVPPLLSQRGRHVARDVWLGKESSFKMSLVSETLSNTYCPFTLHLSSGNPEDLLFSNGKYFA